jgi:hypothetical protein
MNLQVWEKEYLLICGSSEERDFRNMMGTKERTKLLGSIHLCSNLFLSDSGGKVMGA